jgi:hypothetical protein
MLDMRKGSKRIYHVGVKHLQDEHLRPIVIFHDFDILSTFNCLIFHMPPIYICHLFLSIKHGSQYTIWYKTIYQGEGLMWHWMCNMGKKIVVYKGRSLIIHVV